MKITDPPIVVAQTFDAPVSRVWTAITDAGQMREWFFAEMMEFEPIVGFEVAFNVSHEGKNYMHAWKLAEVVFEKKIVYDWRYEGIRGRGSVTWELDKIADGTQLTLTNSIQEEFPQNDPAFRRESGEAGWNYLIKERLKDYLVAN
jgi:uncharacterized protein YndB with AHSA1/START domain